MNWQNNKNYKIAKKDFIDSLSIKQLESLHFSLPKVVFICGGDPAFHKNRSLIEEYFKKNLNRFLTFRAEDAWNVIQETSKASNALELEEWLADFSDTVIILVESFGTVAELGAFSMNPQLRKKLLPIISVEYEKDDSFINTGPLKWIEKDSNYSPPIFADFKVILTSMNEVEMRIKKRFWDSLSFSKKYGIYGFSNKVLLFFYVYVLASLGPIEITEIFNISKEMLKIKDKKHIRFIISIGVALKIFKEIKIGDMIYYTCIDFEKLFSNSSTRNHLNKIQKMRARNLCSLLKIKPFTELLEKAVANS